MPIIIAIVLILGGGISVVADKSLPGQTLYPVKVGVNEEVRGWLSTSKEGEAKLAVTLAERRLEEALKLSLESKLNDEVKVPLEERFAIHADAALKEIQGEIEEGKFREALEMSSEFESRLRANLDVIVFLREKALVNASTLTSLEAKIRFYLDAIAKVRADIEANADAKKDLETHAERRIDKAEKEIAKVKEFIERREVKVDISLTASAKAKIAAAEAALAEAKVKFGAGELAAAFSSANTAVNLAHGARLESAIVMSLKIHNDDDDDDGEGRISKKDDDEDDDADEDEDDGDKNGKGTSTAEIEERSEVEVGSGGRGNHIKEEGTIEVDLDLDL